MEARESAAQAVLRQAAMPADLDEFWTLIAVARTAEEFPPEVEQHRSDVVGVRYYPRGILAQYALGNYVRVVEAFDDPLQRRADEIYAADRAEDVNHRHLDEVWEIVG